jgi:tRNA(Ile)-lysidine synthase
MAKSPVPSLIESLRPAQAPFGAGRVAVAVSGGGDSVALLQALIVAGWPPAQLCVLHIDHARRPESGAESAFVAELAASLGVEMRARRLSAALPGDADTLRSARRAALTALADDCVAIALAHHADDQRETRWLALARGAGLRGLAGMRAWRAPWWRPWLTVSRAEIRTWAALTGLAWREDHSNVDFRHPRARLRHLVLPSLARPLSHSESLRVQVLQDEDAWLDAAATKAAASSLRGPRLDLATFADLAPPLQRRVLRIWLDGHGNLERTEALRMLLLVPAPPRVRAFEIPGYCTILIGNRGAARWLGPWPQPNADAWGGWGDATGIADVILTPWAALPPAERAAARELPAVDRAAGELRQLWPIVRLPDGRVAAPADLLQNGAFIDRHGNPVGLHWRAHAD